MNKENFGKLVAALRKTQFDLTTGKSWSQQIVAEKANLPDRLIASIEQGTKNYLDAETLYKLANVFCLTTMERCEFFAAASDANSKALMMPDEPKESLYLLLQTLKEIQQPAFIHDNMLNVIAVNALMIELFDGFKFDTQMKTTIGANLLAYIFAKDSPIRINMNSHWYPMAMRIVHMFRHFSLRYRYTTYYKNLFQALCTLPDFLSIWMSTHVEQQNFYSHVALDVYIHPIWGKIKFMISRTITMTSYGNLHLCVFVPTNFTARDTFCHLAQTRKLFVEQVMQWPDPSLMEENPVIDIIGNKDARLKAVK